MKNHRVLIVDDEKFSRLALGEFLKEAGYKVASVGTATEALTAQREAPFDVCIVDLRVPDMEGTELILKLHEVSSSSKFIIHTGSPDFMLTPVLRALGMSSTHVVRKPVFDMASFINLVDDLAGRTVAPKCSSSTDQGRRNSV